MKNTSIISRPKAWDYFLLVGRFLLAMIFAGYGMGKLTGTQFGITEAELAVPVGESGLFRLAWHLFDHQPFKAFVGWSQVVCAALLLFNRTALLGALMFIPLVLNILVIDLTIMPPGLKEAFTWRLSSYLVLDLLILYHYRHRMLRAYHALTYEMRTRFRFPIWAYLMLPLLAFLLEFALVIPKTLTYLIIRPAATLDALAKVPAWLMHVIENAP